ncbi:MAG: hypothetical protein WD669_12355 [Pirellulales bacterium]
MQIAKCGSAELAEVKLQIEECDSDTCRLLVDPPSPGAWNMAVDDVLLAAAADEGVATLRFYEWSEPTLSLGYFQHYGDRRRHSASLDCPIVRRQTGGGAIVHDRELTYSLTLPAGHPLAAKAEELYRAVHGAFVAALRPLIAGENQTLPLHIRENKRQHRPEDEPFLCFQRRARGDVLLTALPRANSNAMTGGTPVTTGTTVKILGSAQRRRRGAILQHGSLLLEASPAAPELPGICNLTGVPISASELTAELSTRLSELLHVSLIESRLPDELRFTVDRLIEEKYDLPAWTIRR